MPAKKMLLMGYYGAGNLGDDMMLFCLQKWLARQNVQITVLSEFPDEVRRSFGLPALRNVPLLGEWSWVDAWLRGKALRVARDILGHDGLIVGGGDLIRDDRGWKVLLFTMEKIILAILLGKPVYLVNVGIGRPHTGLGRRLLAWALPRCRKIIVRDQRSLDLCRDFHAPVEYVPDIVLSLEQFLDEPVAPAAGKPYAVVCLRTDPNVFRQFAFGEEQIRALTGILDHLADRHGFDIVFLPFQSADNQMHVRIAARMRHTGRATVRPWSGNLAEVARCVAGACCVVAMRLHAAVLAAAFHRPCILLPYDHKVAEFGRQMHAAHAVLPENLEDLPGLLPRIDRAVAQETTLRSDLEGFSWDGVTLSGPALY